MGSLFCNLKEILQLKSRIEFLRLLKIVSEIMTKMKCQSFSMSSDPSEQLPKMIENERISSSYDDAMAWFNFAYQNRENEICWTLFSRSLNKNRQFFIYTFVTLWRKWHFNTMGVAANPPQLGKIDVLHITCCQINLGQPRFGDCT